MNATFHYYKNEDGWNFEIRAINQELGLNLTEIFTNKTKEKGLEQLRDKIYKIRKLPG